MIQSKIIIIDLGDGVALNRQQARALTNVNPVN